MSWPDESYDLHERTPASGPDPDTLERLPEEEYYDETAILEWERDAAWADEEDAFERHQERRPAPVDSLIDFRCSPLWQDYYSRKGMAVSNAELYDFPCSELWRNIYKGG